MKICSVEGCNGKHAAKGYCDKHYHQYKRCGRILERTKYDPNEIIEYENHAEIILYNRDSKEKARALIDIDDINKIKNHKWSLDGSGYAWNKKDNIMLHRFIIDSPDDKVVDHINRNRLDNRKSNLRMCTSQQNSINRSVQSNNTSGTTGVRWHKRSNKWCAQITLNKKKIHLGYFENKDDAIEARRQAEIEYFGEYRNDDKDVG